MRMINPCGVLPYSSYLYCNSSAPRDVRVADAVSRMNVSEKMSQLGTRAGGVASLNLEAYNWWSEAAHGISRVTNDERTPWQSNFALPITAAASFNRTAWRMTGEAISVEARAFENAGNAYSTYWAPVVNVARDPRWGRNLETAGEDPYLTGEYAVEWVKGFQGDETFLRAAACCKHFAANTMEASIVAGERYTRHDFDAEVEKRDLVDTYFPAFQACVERGRVAGIMCSYNSLNGVPACADFWLLGDVLETEWGFDGYVTSDCDAVQDVYQSHHYTATPEEAVQVTLKAGTDVDCGSFTVSHVEAAYNEGLVDDDDLDAAMTALLATRFRLGHFDQADPFAGLNFDQHVCTNTSRELARDVAGQGVVAMKNERQVLPLDAVEKLAVIGPLANVSTQTATYYGGSPCFKDYGLLGDSCRQRFREVVEAPGLPNATAFDQDLVDHAVHLANTSDAVLLALGFDLSMAQEGHDATGILLPTPQIRLLESIRRGATVPIVVALFTATPLDLTQVLPNCDAILHVGHPAVQSGGLVDILTGVKAPAGRLVQTWYPSSFADQISIFDMNLRPGPSKFPRPDCPSLPCPNGTNPGRTYRFYQNDDVLFPFGFGLSYTTFRYDLVDAPRRLSADRLALYLRNFPRTTVVPSSQSLTDLPFVVNVTNTGPVASDHVVLAFLVPPDAGIDGQPLKQLVAFDRVANLQPNASALVTLYPAAAAFAFPDPAGRLRPVLGRFHLQLSDDLLTIPFDVCLHQDYTFSPS